MATAIRKAGNIMAGYVVGAIVTTLTLFLIIVEAQAREDEANEREMLRTRNWDE